MHRTIFTLLFVAAAMTAHAAIIFHIPATTYQTPLGDSLALAETTYESTNPMSPIALLDATFTFASSTDLREAEVELNAIISGVAFVYAGIVRVVPVGDQLRGQLQLPAGQGITVIGAPGGVASATQRVILPIPEPATWLLIGLPLMLAGMYRRKRAGSTSRQ